MTDREQALRNILNELSVLFAEEMRKVFHEKLMEMIAQMGNTPPAEVKRKRGWPKGKKRGNGGGDDGKGDQSGKTSKAKEQDGQEEKFFTTETEEENE
jgi:hypothetical protein